MVTPHRSSFASFYAVIILVLPALVTGGAPRAAGPPRGRLVDASALTVEEPGNEGNVDLGSSHVSYVELSSRGDMVRREASLTALDNPGGNAGGNSDVVEDGAVTVVAPAISDSERLKLEELTEECMFDNPTAECMEKYGSYGVRKMFTEKMEGIEKLGWLRPGWMSHPEVQKRKLFELTLPGTINSGSYAILGEDGTAAGLQPYGVVSQNLDLYEQLQLGVRMFDIKVAYSSEASLVYMSHGALMIPLANALKDIKKFLQEHEREVIVLDVNKDPNADTSHLKPLIEEEQTNTRVPGQLVHEAVYCELKEMLVTYKVLAKLPGNEFAENPTVGALTDLGAHVVYFWHSQQVLCTTFEECTKTPGWYPSDRAGGFPFAFGPPFALGRRVNATGGRQTARMIEPNCMTHSDFYTQEEQPEILLKKIKAFTEDMRSKTMETRPKCYPVGTKLPDVHTPTLWYTLDGFVTPSLEEQAQQADKMRGVKAIYTRGEGFTVRTEAERTNYLLLSWYLKKNNQEQFLKPNAMMLEFAGAGAMAIIRLIEAMQGRPECGWAIYCKDSGSCWADTLLDTEDLCIPEKVVLQKLIDHADGVKKESKLFMEIAVCVSACIVLGCLANALSKLSHFGSEPKDAEQALVQEQDNESDVDSLPSNQNQEEDTGTAGMLSIIGGSLQSSAPAETDNAGSSSSTGVLGGLGGMVGGFGGFGGSSDPAPAASPQPAAAAASAATAPAPVYSQPDSDDDVAP